MVNKSVVVVLYTVASAAGLGAAEYLEHPFLNHGLDTGSLLGDTLAVMVVAGVAGYIAVQGPYVGLGLAVFVSILAYVVTTYGSGDMPSDFGPAIMSNLVVFLPLIPPGIWKLFFGGIRNQSPPPTRN